MPKGIPFPRVVICRQIGESVNNTIARDFDTFSCFYPYPGYRLPRDVWHSTWRPHSPRVRASTAHDACQRPALVLQFLCLKALLFLTIIIPECPLRETIRCVALLGANVRLLIRMPVPPLVQLHALIHPGHNAGDLNLESDRVVGYIGPTLRPLLLLSRVAAEGHLAPESVKTVAAFPSCPPRADRAFHDERLQRQHGSRRHVRQGKDSDVRTACETYTDFVHQHLRLCTITRPTIARV
jgi:hypothetical protein